MKPGAQKKHVKMTVTGHKTTRTRLSYPMQ